MLQQYNAYLVDKDGRILSESEFISKIADLNEIDNVQHLKVERWNALACGQAAEKWHGLQDFKALEYRTTGSDRVCPICGSLDGLVLATNDQRWNVIFIPNHFGCHCNIVPASTNAALTPEDSASARVSAAKIPTLFRRNVGVEKLVFGDDHPYIKKFGADNLKDLDAEKNYGMQSVEKIYDTAELPNYKPLADKEAANAWWTDKTGSVRGTFDAKGIDGISVTFDKKFKNHVLEENGDDRHRFINQIEAVLKTPDEVWSNRMRGHLTITYIKYYEQYPIVLAVNGDAKAITFYEAQKNGNINFTAVKNLRKGALKYRK